MVLIVLVFSSFLLIFQLDAGVMAQGIVKDFFRYFKNDIKSYLIASYGQYPKYLFRSIYGLW
ncbi:hypothetical protein SKUN_0080 [Spiroplasma kunkelii CR2-3x]|uniref:Uncharacterized protein n=1 Tax=Spiroplasma kunkelii CR2-3x TaxID=273035 RepID=A0A0K2JEJ1_SPIKU|nr:hypothetical protein [Spiroplasma kunkelii]ALA97005.1 hypothetical protein SKUN_0080 [Spiroplasma kunkelii CR2-3x]